MPSRRGLLLALRHQGHVAPSTMTPLVLTMIVRLPSLTALADFSVTTSAAITVPGAAIAAIVRVNISTFAVIVGPLSASSKTDVVNIVQIWLSANKMRAVGTIV